MPKPDIDALQRLAEAEELVDIRPIIAYTMKKSGCTYPEVGKVFGVTKQMASKIVKRIERKL